MKIKPCKHCGVRPVVERLSGDRSFAVRCNNPDRGDICDQKFYNTISNSSEEAIKKWNEVN